MAIVAQEIKAGQTQGERAWKTYYRLRAEIETPENIGRLIIIDANSGDYGIAGDDLGLAECDRLRAQHPTADLFGLRIGYKTAISFCGDLERLP